MKKVILAMILIGCSAETTTVTVGAGGENTAGTNSAGVNSAGTNSGGSNTGGTIGGGSNTGGNSTGAGSAINEKPQEFQALGSNGFCYKYKDNGLTLGNYLGSEYTIYSVVGDGIRNADGTCVNSSDNLDTTKWVNVQNEIFNTRFFGTAQNIVENNFYVDFVPTAKCIYNEKLNDRFIFDGNNFLIERTKIGMFLANPGGIGSYRVFEPKLQNDKITDYMKPIREYFVEQYVTGKTCE